MSQDRSAFDAYRLTAMQQGILFHALQDPERNDYVVQVSSLLSGLDRDRWKRAWAAVTAQHEVLRAAFSWKQVKRPVQVIAQQVELDWLERDCASEGMSEVQFEEYLASDRQRGFVLSRSPLMRFALITLPAGDHRFVWSYHHLILDGWSALIVMSDVLQAYGRGPAQAAPVAPRFKSYVSWLESRDTSAARSYWTRKLSNPGTFGVLQLPASPDLPMPGTVKEVRLLTDQNTATAADFVRRQRLTLATFMQGLWALMLHRYCNAARVVFGWVMSDRPQALAEASGMVGLMISTVPVAMTVDPLQPIEALFEQMTKASDEAAEHGHLPLAEIQQLAGIDTRQALFESVMIFENLPSNLKPADTHGLRITERRTHWQTSYPLSLMVVPGARLKLEFSFETSRHERATIRRMLLQLEALVAGVARRPATVQQLLDTVEDWGAARAVLQGPIRARPDLSVARALTARLRAAPHRTAVVSGEDEAIELTGAELDERSGIAAEVLARARVGRGVVVAIHMSRSPGLLVAMLAILHVGATMLPLDTELPAGRKSQILSSAGAAFAIASTEDALPLPTVVIDQRGIVQSFPGLPQHAVRTASPLGSDMAYIMFTSGSTGVPKGVAVPESALHNLLLAMAESPGLSEGDVFLAVTTVSFDIAMLELLLPLLVGARLVVASERMARNAESLARAMTQFDVTVMQATPTSFRMLLSSGWQGSPGFRAWCGGEALDRDLAEQVLAGGGQLWNLYGPTETTIWTMVARVLPQAGPISIGTPVANARCLLLDPWLRPVPQGVAGDLYVAGDGLAAGYLGDPGANARSFLPDPHAPGAGARMYRTGDQVRLDANGAVRFIGRQDRQIKLRGHRIELGEIEAILCEHPAVKVAGVVLSRVRGDEQIVAYYESSEELAAAELTALLSARLPPAAVPGHFVRLASLPLTPNGKLDRQALPAPTAAGDGPAVRGSHRPWSLVRDAIDQAWRSVLGVPVGDQHDNFFAMGGHSHKAISLISAVNRACKVSLPLSAIFDNPTAGGLAEAVERAWCGESPQAQARPGDVDLSLPQPMSLAQERLYYVTQIAPGSHPFQLSVAVTLEGGVEIDGLQRALATLQSRHAILRTSFAEVDGRPVQLVGQDCTARLETVDRPEALSGRDEDWPSLELLSRTARDVPLSLIGQVPMRCICFRSHEARSVLLLAIHHILIDEWSLDLLIEDLMVCYQADVAGRPAPAPRADLAFAAHAAHERHQLEQGAFEADLRYWTSQLDGARATTLPARRLRPVVPTFRGGHHTLSIAPAAMTRLGALATACSVTRFAVLTSAFGALLHKYLSDSDICLGIMDAGRDAPWLDNMIGPLARPLVLRVAVPAARTFRQVVDGVQRTFLDAHRHRSAPFQQIVQRLGLARNDGVSQLFRIMLVMQNMPVSARSFGGIAIQPVAVDSGTAETDLLVEMFEQERGLTIRFTYDLDLYDALDIERFARRLQHLMDIVIQDPDVVVSSIELSAETADDLADAFRESWTSR